MQEREEHTLSYFGLNTSYIYSMVQMEDNILCVGLQSGIVLQLKYYFNAVDATYQNYYAVREGLTEVVVKNMTTGAEVLLDTGSYV